jgi:ribonucleotide monophosphatase NagD (HAD superfamily)
LNEAFQLIRQGCPLFAIHKARYYATETSLALGPGPFIAALEYATGIKATVIGKVSL